MPRAIRRSVLTAVAVLALSGGQAAAQALSHAATHAAPQHYVILLPDAPVADVAGVVLGESLGLPYEVDPRVQAQMTFRVDGARSPEQLVNELAERLWEVDVALMDRPDKGLWLIPKAAAPAALTAGAVGIGPAAALAPAPKMPTVEIKPETGDAPWWAWLAAGWAGGAATVVVGQAAWRRRRRIAERPAALSLTGPVPHPDDTQADDEDLIIPVFRDADPRT